jgi:hypothetical protein
VLEIGTGWDVILSVEMIEAVGEPYWPAYFATLDRLLAPGGRVGLQAITMPHDRMLATRIPPSGTITPARCRNGGQGFSSHPATSGGSASTCLPADVEPLSRLLRSRLPLRLPRRPPAPPATSVMMIWPA